MVSKAILVGRVGSTPKVNGKVVTFSVATNKNWKDKDGNKQERATWHNIVSFGKLAEICATYLKKGQLVYIEGDIQDNNWEDSEGNKRKSVEIAANQMTMLGSKGDKPQEEDTSDVPFN
jgi:single-strand DNA-binding protein